MDLIKLAELVKTYDRTLTNTWRYNIIDIKEDNGYVIQIEFIFYTNSCMYNIFKINIRISHELCDKQTEHSFNHYIQNKLNEYILAGMLKLKEEISDTFSNQNYTLETY